MRIVLAVLLALLGSACGSSPAAPTPPPQPASVAGNWSGTFQYKTANGGDQPFITAIVMNLSQAGAAVNGTYGTQSFNGTVTGNTTTSSTFSGTFTWNATSTSGTPCTGTFSVSGSVSTNTVNWTSPAVTGNCTNLPLSITIAAQLR